MTIGTRAAVALEAMPLCADLSAAQLSTLAGLVRRRSVSSGATLMLMEDQGEVAYLIARGTVKVCAEQADGSEVILALLGAGEVVGELSLLGPRTRAASVVTLEACELLALSRVNFESCLRAMPVLPLNLARLLARRLRLADAQIQALGTLDIAGRVARQLLAFAEEYGEPADGGGVLIP
ncbi:MAG: Crp/Fnr family transcriptional regulator, partial [Chloroflexota bacterium]|nr:Crp/Fnr family transcriptional regulator [Chloroflexota bacterium]